ncbi:MAG TPA: GAF domain-containing protein, partial [Candidatus Ozemobacteraceae bacterium]|nr:GAF domain-containing protein [Candidatus Ozemobacteraceae bacterium]
MMSNALDTRLADMSDADRDRYLRGKYRELQLINRLDRITDRYSRLPRLMEKSLALMQSFFGVSVAAVQLTSAEQLENRGFYYTGPADASEALQSAARDLLAQFLSEPQVEIRQRHESGPYAQSGLTNTLIIPMVITSEIAGAFLLANRDEAFSESDVHFLKVFSSQLDNAVIHARVLDDYRKTARDLKQRVRQLNVLYEMSLSLGLGFDFESLAKRIIESTQQIVPFDRCSIMLYDKKSDDLKTEVVVGEKQKIRLVHLSRGKGIAGLALLSKRPILAEHGSEDERFVP